MQQRETLIDFLRGLCVLDMILVHYSDYFALFGSLAIPRVIRFTDFAIEGFLILAGFMVGRKYCQGDDYDWAHASLQLFRRALNILKIQYVLVLTASFPLALVVGDKITHGESPEAFLIRSLLLLNQVPLMHILPTFIPLFVLAVPIVMLVRAKRTLLVLILSAGAFVVGNYRPYLFGIGDKAIFPIVLWQIYFVLGILLGSNSWNLYSLIQANVRKTLLAAIAIFCFMAFIYFGHHLSPWWLATRDLYHIYVRKFPLNFLALLYYGSIFVVIYSTVLLTLKAIIRFESVTKIITLYGRNSIMAFVIHVYFCYAVTFISPNPNAIAYTLIMANFLFTWAVLSFKDSVALDMLRKGSISPMHTVPRQQ